MKRYYSEKTYNRIRKKRVRALKKYNRTPCQVPEDDWTLATRDKLINKVNRPEERIDALLSQCQCTYFRERPIMIGGARYFIDFLIVSLQPGRKKVRLAIEVDGGYHNTPEQQAKDAKREAELLRTSRVWRILRITTSRAMTITAEELRKAIEDAPMRTVVRLGRV